MIDSNLKSDKNIACCLSVRDCSNFLPYIFNNLNNLGKHFINFYIIFVYDNCKDNTELLLNEYKEKSRFNVYVINNKNNNSPHRTVRIANSRNRYIDIVYNVIKVIDFHIVIDADDVNVKSWNIDIIKKYLDKDNWDSISFNRDKYYDIWALLYGDYKHHCWGFNEDSRKVVNHMRNDITNKLNNLNDDELFTCLSAFNGFAIYRTPKFINIRYDGLYSNHKRLFSDEERENTLNVLRKELNDDNLQLDNNSIQSCEHIYYHVTSIYKNNARIRISKDILVNDISVIEHLELTILYSSSFLLILLIIVITTIIIYIVYRILKNRN